jgi:hypothetical protein
MTREGRVAGKCRSLAALGMTNEDSLGRTNEGLVGMTSEGRVAGKCRSLAALGMTTEDHGT